MFWWVKLDLFSLECNEVSSSEFLGVYGFDMALGSLSLNAQCCGGWRWISSLWSAMKCPVVSFEMFMGLV